ncbi:hypothetical protein NIES4071_82530 [Calothrix sp. NIES-4071]|nr:hypothetical protein NIES4071_82530 [Calothrix sp. NIES-4071]BAZ62522.1 hypothetical protein NIES4105_82460 [Calothrix sp. NIES-4105]
MKLQKKVLVVIENYARLNEETVVLLVGKGRGSGR